MGIDVHRQIQIQDNLTQLLRDTMNKGRSVGFGSVDESPLGEVVAVAEGKEIQIGEKKFTPKVRIISTQSGFVMASGGMGENVSTEVAAELLDRGDRWNLTHAMNESKEKIKRKVANAKKT